MFSPGPPAPRTHEAFAGLADLDRARLPEFELLARKDADGIAELPATNLESGSSEIRNWLAAAGALEHLDVQLVDYVPCYRSEAGTGVGFRSSR